MKYELYFFIVCWQHPGGEDPLLDAAGLDATIAFDDVGHSEDAVSVYCLLCLYFR